MANENLNPLSRLLDVDFPDIKRANWNNSYDSPTTADVGFVNVVHCDHIMAGTRASLNFDSASFANATRAPLYGRYRVKYLAVWAPDRLYMPDWLSGEKMVDDNYPYPTINPLLQVAVEGDDDTYIYSATEKNLGGAGTAYVPPTSLMEQLGMYPAYFHANYWNGYPDKNAFAFLAFWDAYRTFILNPQEKVFPVRTRAFTPQINFQGVDLDTAEPIVVSSIPAQVPRDSLVEVAKVDEFFKQIKRVPEWSPGILQNAFERYFGFPMFPNKRVYCTNQANTPVTSLNPSDFYLADEFHYGLPLCPYFADPYTSFISNENVELERTKSKVTVQNNEFTMEQWYLASRMQTKIRKNIYKMQDFSQWIDTNFGVKPSTTLTQPMFLGAFMSDIIFHDAISAVQGASDRLEDNQSLGSRAGYGVGHQGDRRNFFDFTAKEPGTVLVLQMIIPEVHYFEGSERHFDTLNFNEEFNPIFDALGFQDMHLSNLNSVPHLSYDPFARLIKNPDSLYLGKVNFDDYDRAIAQQPYGFEHMAKVNRLKGMMTMPNYYQSWTLARSFNYNRGDVNFLSGGSILPDRGDLGMYSTYIIPEMYNNIFANPQNLDNFQFYLSFDYKKYQPVSKQFLSFHS